MNWFIGQTNDVKSAILGHDWTECLVLKTFKIVDTGRSASTYHFINNGFTFLIKYVCAMYCYIWSASLFLVSLNMYDTCTWYIVLDIALWNLFIMQKYYFFCNAMFIGYKCIFF